MQVRKLRLLRQRSGISLEELGVAAGVTAQRMSELELGSYSPGWAVRLRVSDAFFTVAREREESLRRLQEDLSKHKDSLFELVEDDYEL